MSLAKDTARWKGVNLFSRAAIIRSELVRMSRDGWKNAKPEDYQPLERELREIEAEQTRREGKRVKLRGEP